jgi:hypothetical protein
LLKKKKRLEPNLVGVVLLSQKTEGGLDDTTSETKDQMKGRLWKGNGRCDTELASARVEPSRAQKWVGLIF